MDSNVKEKGHELFQNTRIDFILKNRGRYTPSTAIAL